MAPTITTPFNSSTPSISLSKDVSTFSAAVVELSPSLSPAIASISSKKIIDGDAALALRKISRMALSDSPTYLLKISGPLTAKKLSPDSVAKALAVKVFEQPGGP
ncbi:Uncharacterised protein [Chlamydia trachomatis]|nr:Uncharacterised protein [Chlamydia trachomatis]